MRKAFRGYHPPTDEELAKLWSEGLIVLDTNALLHLFRYSASTRDELIELLNKYQDRIWIPHHVGSEFHRNRRTVPAQETKSFGYVETVLDEATTTVIASLSALKRPALEADRIAKLTKKHMRKIRRGLRKIKKQHLAAVLAEEAHERTFAVITGLYEGRVGTPFTADQTKKAHADGADRFAKKIPPGYADGNKDAGRKYGDLILWLQMLEEGKARKVPMLFVTDDAKEDWWDLSGGYPSGPRAELVEEYYVATDERVHFYTPRDFLNAAKERGEEISDQTVDEARKVSTHYTLGEGGRVGAAAVARLLEAQGRRPIADILDEYDRTSGTSDRAREYLAELGRAQSPRLSAYAEALRSTGEASNYSLGSVAEANLQLALQQHLRHGGHVGMPAFELEGLLSSDKNWDEKIRHAREVTGLHGEADENEGSSDESTR